MTSSATSTPETSHGDCCICQDRPLDWKPGYLNEFCPRHYKEFFTKKANEVPDCDPVETPEHYTAGEIECIDAIKAMLTEREFSSYCRAHAVRYLWRSPLKGNYVQDLKKARQYIDFALEALGKDDG